MTNYNMSVAPAEFCCLLCFRCFKRKGDLTRHENLHSGEKRYKCDQCDKRFSQLSGMKTHLNVHSKLKPYKCGIDGCTSVFGDPSSCSRHRKEIHHIGGLYKCPHATCKSKIKRRSAFVAHIKKHGIDPSELDIDVMASTTVQWKRSGRDTKPGASSWYSPPVTDFTPISAPQFLFNVNATAATVPGTTCHRYENTSYLLSSRNNNNITTLHSRAASPGSPNQQFYNITPRCSSDWLSPAQLNCAFSPSPSQAPSPSSLNQTYQTEVTGYDHMLLPQSNYLQTSVAKDHLGWEFDSMFFS